MSYKYFTAGSPPYFESTAVAWLSDLQDFVSADFANAPSMYGIQEETSFASGSLVDVNVRIVTAIDSVTGEKLGDDFKTLLFKDFTHTVGIGFKYFFDNNWWVTTYTELYKSFISAVTVRRCNNVLRWVDENGVIYQEPCAIEYAIKQNRDNPVRNNPIEPEGFTYVYSQLNSKTRKIKSNQRFLFGNSDNRVCFKVFGEGVRNFLNQQTENDNSASLLMLTMGAYEFNTETDDLQNGIADRYKYNYSLTLTPTTYTGNVGETVQLQASLLLDSNPVVKPLLYKTSASTVATVSASGLVTMLSNGSTIITGCMLNNTSASTTSIITVSASAVDQYEVRVSPNDGFILQDETIAYNVYLYKNGVQQSDTFTFTLNPQTVPSNYYTYTSISGNSFSVKNKLMYMGDTLLVDCVNGSYSTQVSILLKGAW